MPPRSRSSPFGRRPAPTAALLAALLLLGGCQSPPPTEPPSAPAASSQAQDAPVCGPLYIIGDSEAATLPFQLKADELCQRFGVRPVVRHPPYQWHDLDQIVEEAGDQVDLVILPPSRLDIYIRRGLLQPLDPWIDEEDPWFTDILPAYRNLYMRFGDHYYGAVYDGDSHLLFYRADLFRQHGLEPPTTWEEHDRAAQILSDALQSAPSPRYGTAMAAVPNLRYPWFVERFVSYGGRYFDEHMHPLIAGPEGIRALSELVALHKQVAPDAAYDWADLNRAFLGGNLGMVIQWSDTARFTFDQQVWDSQVEGKVNWALVPGEPEVPLRGGIWVGRILGVAARSLRPDVAAQVALYITGPEVSGEMVTRPDTINDPYRYSHFAHPEKQTLFPTPELAAEFYEVLLASLKRPMADLTIPGGWEYTRVLDMAVGRALQGDQTPAAALHEAAAQWEAITERYGREAQKAAYQDWVQRLNGGSP